MIRVSQKGALIFFVFFFKKSVSIKDFIPTFAHPKGKHFKKVLLITENINNVPM